MRQSLSIASAATLIHPGPAKSRPLETFAALSSTRSRSTPVNSISRFNRRRETPVERLKMAQQVLMVSAQLLKFLGKLKRRQNRQIDRIYRLPAGANIPNLFVNRRRNRAHPLVVICARAAAEFQLLPHDFDVDAAHLQPRSRPSNRARMLSIRSFTSARAASCSRSSALAC